MKNFVKLKIALEYQLLGKGYFQALKAFELARKYHSGNRKDGTTPEFQHQVEIALFLLTLKDVNDEENVITTALLHDIREDYGIDDVDIRKDFGDIVANSVEKMTKKFKGTVKDKDFYFEELSSDPIASLVKGADRINNVNSMVGVFTAEKQLSYVNEVDKFFLPMLKSARKKFPKQSYAYLNIETYLMNMSRFVKHGKTNESQE